ncbi:MAG: TetR/AcrR family transcriptional regulator [Atopobiaceae bacterium]
MDRRQRKTRTAIYQAFESLVNEEPYAQITVAQIIERADIGRSTFYAHFQTKDELLDDMCTQIFDHIFEGVNTHCITHRALNDTDLEGRLAHLLYHLRDNYASICGKLLKEGEPHFTRYFSTRLRELIQKGTPSIPEGVPQDLALDMYVSSFRQAVVWWVDRGEKDDPEQLASWYARVVGL